MTAERQFQTNASRNMRVFPSSPTSPAPLREEALEAAPSFERVLRHPEGRTVSTNTGGDDEWSDENLRMWEEEDKLDPELEAWVRATLGE